MNNRKRNILLIILGIILASISGDAYAANPEVWTLEQCVSAALEKSYSLESSRASVAGADAAMRSASAARWPTLGLSGAYSYTSETQTLDFASPLPGFQIPPVKFGDGNVYDMAVTARAPIFVGGALREKARADAAAHRSAEENFAADSLKLLWDVRRAYFQTLGAEARADAARQAAARMERHVAEITAAIFAGWQSEEARIAATASLRQIESALIGAETAAQAERLRLGELVGAPYEEIQPDGNLETGFSDERLSQESLLETRAEIRALRARIEQSKHLTRATQGSLLPSISATAAYHYGKPGVNVVENEWMDYYVVGVSANWTLWDWNARKYQVQQIRASARALEANRNDLENALVNRREIALHALDAARAIRGKAAERAELEQTRLNLVEGRWRQGMATESEMLDAQDDLTQAETDWAVALANERLAEADLLYASGY